MSKKIRDKIKDNLKKLDLDMFNLGLNERSEFEYYSTGFKNIDWLLGGGLAKGDFIEIYGLESSGKTTFALQVVSNFLKMYKDKVVLYVDVEHSLDINWVKFHIGDNIDRVEIIQPDFMEVMGDAIRLVLDEDYVDFIVIDTLMAAVPKAIFLDDSNAIGSRARAEARFVMGLNPVIKKKGIPVLVLNQMRIRDIGGNKFGLDVGGGTAKRYLMNESIFIHKPRKLDNGFSVIVETKKNKHKVPFLKTELRFIENKGFDRDFSLIKGLMETGEVFVKGGWYYYKDKNYRLDDLLDVLKNDKNF